MKTDKLYFGAAYYSEYLPYDRVEKDMEMMEKAGMNVIRIAESTWSTLEPQEGVYDFTHIDRMLDAAARHHISVIVGTPTYAVPTWLVKKISGHPGNHPERPRTLRPPPEYGYHRPGLPLPRRACDPRSDGACERCAACDRLSA